MPLKSCNENDRPGYKWGDRGKCYTYKAGDKAGQKAAKKKAIKQGIAIEGPKKFKEEITKSEAEDISLAEEVVQENPEISLRDYLK